MNNNDAPNIFIPGWSGNTDLCKPEVKAYANGRVAIDLLYWDDEMQDWFPHCHLTVNLPDQHLNEGELFVKDWAENELIANTLLEFGWLERTGREVISGFVAPMVARPAGALKEFLDNSPMSR